MRLLDLLHLSGALCVLLGGAAAFQDGPAAGIPFFITGAAVGLLTIHLLRKGALP